jgi:hypothetical protein
MLVPFLQCHKSLNGDNFDENPPKFTVSNHFAIGNLPEIWHQINTKEISGPLLPNVRPFTCFMSSNGEQQNAFLQHLHFFIKKCRRRLVLSTFMLI